MTKIEYNKKELIKSVSADNKALCEALEAQGWKTAKEEVKQEPIKRASKKTAKKKAK